MRRATAAGANDSIPLVPRFDAVIFDLDGTLVDSFDPIAQSVNAARAARGLPALGRADVTAHVGRGLEALLSDLVGPDGIEASVAAFRSHYARVFLEGTRALPRALATTRALAARGVRLAVASNKPARFGRPIVDSLGFGPHVELVLGPDERTPPKPEPAMLHSARTFLGASAARTLYVGDMPIDVRSARAAGLPHLVIPGIACSLSGLLTEPGSWSISQIQYLQQLMD